MPTVEETKSTECTTTGHGTVNIARSSCQSGRGTAATPDHLIDTASVSESRTSLPSCKSSSHSTNEDSLECREGQLDPLRFRTMFLQAVEELRMRRGIDVENDNHIKHLLAENQELQKRAEEEKTNNEKLIEQHSQRERDIRRDCEEKMSHAENNKLKTRITSENWDHELKALKSEIRALQLVKYNLEKKVTEQERQLHLQSSSRDTYLSQMNELDQKCSAIFKQAEDVSEQIEKLATNVRCSKDLHLKVQYVNEHQKCELEACRNRLEECRAELIEARVRGTEKQLSEYTEENTATTKATDQELKMKTELNKQLQEQLSSLRNEHQDVLRQLKDAHSLVAQHALSLSTATTNEDTLRKEASTLVERVDVLKSELDDSVKAQQAIREKLVTETSVWTTKYADIEARLKSLQEDYTTLQKAHERETEMKDNKIKSAELTVVQLENEVKCLQEQVTSMKQDTPVLGAHLKERSDEGSTESNEKGNQTKLTQPAADSVNQLSTPQQAQLNIQVPSPPQADFSPDVLAGSPDSVATAQCNETPEHKLVSPVICEESRDGNQIAMEVSSTQTVEAPVAKPEVRESPQESMKRPSTLEDSAIDRPSPKKPKMIQSEEVLTQKREVKEQLSNTTSTASQPSSGVKTTACDSSNIPIQDPLTAEPSEVSPSKAGTELKDPLMSESDHDQPIPAPTSEQTVRESEQPEPEEADCDTDQQAEGVGGVSIMFSDEEDGGGRDDKLLSTQMSKQIDKVQMFLKLNRLRRPKK